MMGVIFFLSSADFFSSKFTDLKILSGTLSVSNALDPDQDRRFEKKS